VDKLQSDKHVDISILKGFVLLLCLLTACYCPSVIVNRLFGIVQECIPMGVLLAKFY
jgi:hypothetical protein